ncbi:MULTISPECIES: hypothetical protein [Olivibacter]|uniref:Secreted protein n=1 Tax=Olivibacter oleidegradans TaxID=760123 RepID=A0ABV6HQN2_9SPHI|nr:MULTISPECIES: hypothetical protein [Olivibacter]QEL03960.1 hypothetical protein FKG96_25045 [Olivibacter sp. LS-1]
MRKVGAISFAAFYLLLTTGLFVCILHCSGAYLFNDELSISLVHDSDSKEHKSKKTCDKGKDCDCCNEHGEYVIKENIATHKQTINEPELYCLLDQEKSFLYTFYRTEVKVQVYSMDTGPPKVRKKPIYILNQTFLI